MSFFFLFTVNCPFLGFFSSRSLHRVVLSLTRKHCFCRRPLMMMTMMIHRVTSSLPITAASRPLCCVEPAPGLQEGAGPPLCSSPSWTGGCCSCCQSTARLQGATGRRWDFKRIFQTPVTSWLTNQSIREANDLMVAAHVDCIQIF